MTMADRHRVGTARLATVALTVAMAAGCRSAPAEAPLDAARAQLTAALQQVRPFGPRVSATGLARGRALSATRGSATSLPADLLLGVAHLEKAAANRDDGDGIAARGLARLVAGDTTRAIVLLTDALLEQPYRLDALTDLSAAYFLRGSQARHAVDLVRALDTAERAAPGSVSARFNRALALETVGLHTLANEAWMAFLSTNPAPEWREEAQHRLAESRERTVQGLPSWERDRTALMEGSGTVDTLAVAMTRVSPQWTRECLEDEVLPAWAAAALAKDHSGAARLRAAALALADAVASATGSSWAHDIVEPLRPQGRTAGAGRLGRFAEGVSAYGRARLLTESDAWQAAVEPLQDARRILLAMRNPLALNAELDLVSAAYHRRELAAVGTILDGVEREARRRQYPSLLGRAAWLRAADVMQRQQRSLAAMHIDQAIAAFERARETANRYAAHNLAASNWRDMGEHARSWQHMTLALQHVDAIRSLRRRYVVFLNASLLAIRDGLPYAGLRFQDAAVGTAQARGSTGPIVESLIRRARLYARLGRAQEAEADLRAAESATAAVPEPAFRESYARWARVVRAELAAPHEPTRALGLLDADTVDGLTAREREEAPHTLYLRGLANLALGRAREAARDFDAGVLAVEQAWALLSRDEHRLGLFDNVAELFASAAGLRLAAGDAAGAFSYAERSRGRALGAALGLDARPASLDAVRRALPDRTTLVFYMTAGESVEVLAIGTDRTSRARIRVRRSEIERRARRLERQVHDGSPAWTSSSSAVFDGLITPVAASFTPGDLIVFVPEGRLHRIPFAALRDPRTGRCLVQDYAIAVAPSAGVAVAALTRARTMAPPARALVVAVPDGRADEGLRPLRAVEREAAAVAGNYAVSRVLSGAAATKRAVLEAATLVPVVHFAAHAVADERNPEASRLLLPSADGRGDSALRASEITSAAFGRVALVVLGACSTADGDVYRTEGVMSLARPFLAAGVPSVVATLWDVDDEAAAFVLTAFHREFSRHGDAASALRAAQLAAMASDDPRLAQPSAWAGFEVLGATALAMGVRQSRTEER
jgi:CHAT domain-containing protein